MREQDAKAAWRAILDLTTTGPAMARHRKVAEIVGAPARVSKLLLHLSPGEPETMKDLAEHIGCDASYVTALVDELESRGLAARHVRSDDRRVKTVGLTDAGEKVREEALVMLEEPPESFARLGAAELRELRRLLERLSAPPGA